MNCTSYTLLVSLTPPGTLNSDILLPTIKHLLPNTTELKCQHSGKCLAISTFTVTCEIKTVNEKLYKLEPFEDDVATLSDDNGVLELTQACKGDDVVSPPLTLFIKDKPYEPFYPVYCKTVDDDTLRRFIATLKDDDEIVILR